MNQKVWKPFDKAALKALAITLNKELQSQNIFVGVVTIMGNVAPETYYAPELIAEEYWGLYTNRKEYEVILNKIHEKKEIVL